jgi:hypothetical protein
MVLLEEYVYTFPWYLGYSVQTAFLVEVPIWVEFRDRDVIYEPSRHKLIRQLGKIIHFHQGDGASTFPHDRACIMWDLRRVVPSRVRVRYNKTVLWQRVQLLGVPKICSICSSEEHLSYACPQCPIQIPALTTQNSQQRESIATQNSCPTVKRTAPCSPEQRRDPTEHTQSENSPAKSIRSSTSKSVANKSIASHSQAIKRADSKSTYQERTEQTSPGESSKSVASKRTHRSQSHNHSPRATRSISYTRQLHSSPEQEQTVSSAPAEPKNDGPEPMDIGESRPKKRLNISDSPEHQTSTDNHKHSSSTDNTRKETESSHRSTHSNKQRSQAYRTKTQALRKFPCSQKVARQLISLPESQVQAQASPSVRKPSTSRTAAKPPKHSARKKRSPTPDLAKTDIADRHFTYTKLFRQQHNSCTALKDPFPTTEEDTDLQESSDDTDNTRYTREHSESSHPQSPAQAQYPLF